jgi:hypothetical protein
MMGNCMEPEDRSFAPETWRMGELTPIDVEGLSAEQAAKAAVLGVVQVHACLEQHITEQTKANAASALSDLTIREDLQKLTLAFGLRKPEEGEKPPRAKTLAAWPPWAVLAALGGVGVGLPALAQLAEKVAPIFWQWLLTLGT